MAAIRHDEATLRASIIELSERLFREKLYSQVSTNEISQSLGISKKTLYKHFSTKEEILRHIVAQTSGMMNNKLDGIYADGSKSFVERVLACLDTLRFLYQQVSPQKLMQDIQRHAPAAWSDVRQTMHKRVNVVAQFLESGKQQSAVRDDVAPEIAALIYMSTMANVMDEGTLRGVTIERNTLHLVFTELFYTGMFSDQGRVSLEKTRLDTHQLTHIPTIEEFRASRGEQLTMQEQILAVSRQQFFRYGFSKVRMDEIASELRISKKTLYNHFSGKEDLLREVLKHFASDINRAHAYVDSSGCDSFVSSIRSFVMYMAKMLGEITPQFVRDLLRTSPELFEELYDWRSSAIDSTFQNLLSAGQHVGAVRVDYSSEELSQTYRVVVDSVLSPEVLSMTSYRAIELYKALVNAMFIGVLDDSARTEFRQRSARSTPLHSAALSITHRDETGGAHAH